jgi:hypothetical protein
MCHLPVPGSGAPVQHGVVEHTVNTIHDSDQHRFRFPPFLQSRQQLCRRKRLKVDRSTLVVFTLEHCSHDGWQLSLCFGLTASHASACHPIYFQSRNLHVTHELNFWSVSPEEEGAHKRQRQQRRQAHVHHHHDHHTVQQRPREEEEKKRLPLSSSSSFLPFLPPLRASVGQRRQRLPLFPQIFVIHLRLRSSRSSPEPRNLCEERRLWGGTNAFGGSHLPTRHRCRCQRCTRDTAYPRSPANDQTYVSRLRLTPQQTNLPPTDCTTWRLVRRKRACVCCERMRPFF